MSIKYNKTIDDLIYSYLKINGKLPALNGFDTVVSGFFGGDNSGNDVSGSGGWGDRCDGVKDEVNPEQYKERLRTIKEYRKILKKLIEIPVIEQRTPEWFEARIKMLSASDTYKGVRMYKDLIRKKVRGMMGINDERMILNDAIKWGVMFEPVANTIYSEMNNGIRIHEFGLIKDPNLDCFGASPDGISELGIMLEIKCPYSRPIIHGRVKEDYYYQIQGQLAVCGLKECDFAEFKFCKISREEYDNMVLEDVKDCFYGIIVEDEPSDDKNSVNPKYIYSKLREPADEFIPDNTSNVIYWVLEDIHIKRVKFDQERWESEIVPKIKLFWNEVLRVKEISEKQPMRYSSHYFIEDDD